MLHAPGSKHGDGTNVSANPGWRKAVALVIANKDPEKNISADGLRKLAPDMGTYINEASVSESFYASSFWGSNYARLSAIKAKFDPEMVLWTSPGVNADWMHVVDGRACMVSPRPERPSKYGPETERRHAVDMSVDGDFIFGRQEITGQVFPVPGEEEGVHWV